MGIPKLYPPYLNGSPRSSANPVSRGDADPSATYLSIRAIFAAPFKCELREQNARSERSEVSGSRSNAVSANDAGPVSSVPYVPHASQSSCRSAMGSRGRAAIWQSARLGEAKTVEAFKRQRARRGISAWQRWAIARSLERQRDPEPINRCAGMSNSSPGCSRRRRSKARERSGFEGTLRGRVGDVPRTTAASASCETIRE